MAGKKITVGRGSVDLGPELEASIDRLVRDIGGDVINIVEKLAEELAENARKEWYNNVTERTGASGRGNDYRMEVRGDKVHGVVFNDAKQRQKTKETRGMLRREVGDVNYAYYVHRPGVFSSQLKRLNDAEYAEVMKFWKANGELPEGYIAEEMHDSKGRRRPVGVSKKTDNPDSYDGKNLWKLLVLGPSKKAIEDALPDLDKAMKESAKRFSRGTS